MLHAMQAYQTRDEIGRPGRSRDGAPSQYAMVAQTSASVALSVILAPVPGASDRIASISSTPSARKR